jgi:hypothetical protein
VARKIKPKTFVRDGEVAYAYTPADEVGFVYNGWREQKPPPPAPAADNTGNADKPKPAPKKAAG